MRDKKGQLTLGDAPTVVLLVGLVFLVMATIAFIGEKYQGAMPSNNQHTVTLEAVTQTELAANARLVGVPSTDCNPETYAIIAVRNGSITLDAPNYTLTAATGNLKNLTSEFVTVDWTVNYTYYDAGVGCDVNADLQTNLSENTSIAGIVLTISLVGIVLSILIGVFLGIRKSRV